MRESVRFRALLLLVLVVTLALAAWLVPLEEWTQALLLGEMWRSPRGVLFFVLLYVVWNFALPPAPLQVLAGIHFGFLPGLLVIVFGTSLANIISHGLGRWLGRSWMARRVEESERLQTLERAVVKLGWKGVVLLRLSNLVPSNLANLLMGATPLRLPTILWASLLGSLPGWVVTLLLGQGGKELLEGNGYARWTLYLLGAGAAILLLAVLGRQALRTLKQEGQPSESTD